MLANKMVDSERGEEETFIKAKAIQKMKISARDIDNIIRNLKTSKRTLILIGG
jgi:hypothetical protein